MEDMKAFTEEASTKVSMEAFMEVMEAFAEVMEAFMEMASAKAFMEASVEASIDDMDEPKLLQA